MQKLLLITAFLFVICLSYTSCGFYSFRDASIPAEIKTVKIEAFGNVAPIVNVNLANDITREFRRLVANQTNLVQTNLYNPDLIISGYISRYSVELQGINAQTQTASQNQLTTVFHLSVKCNLEDKTIYKDIEEDIQVLKQFDGQKTFQEVEASLVSALNTEIPNLIFSKAFSNW